MTDRRIETHNGIRFQVEAIALGDVFAGRFTLLDGATGGSNGSSGSSGTDDSYRPTIDNAWATPTEALTYATEAAHHAIEGIAPFTDGQPQ